jgi:hypothetical protein
MADLTRLAAAITTEPKAKGQAPSCYFTLHNRKTIIPTKGAYFYPASHIQTGATNPPTRTSAKLLLLQELEGGQLNWFWCYESHL